MRFTLTNSDIQSYFAINAVRPSRRLSNTELLPGYAQKLVEHYSAQPYILAIMTIGSLASDKTDEYSDIDLVLICGNEGIPSKETRVEVINYISNNMAALNSIDVHTWNFGTADDFVVANTEVCTQFFTKQYLEEKIDLTTNGFYSQVGMEHPLASLSSLLKATVHFDRDNIYKSLRQKIDPYPAKLRQIILNQELGMRFPYYLDRLSTAMARGDIPFADKMIHQSIDSAIYIIFALHEQYPNGPKRLFQQLDDMVAEPTAKDVKSYLTSLYADSTVFKTLPQKQATLQKLLALLQKLNNA